MENLLVPFHAEIRIPCHRAIVLAPHPDDEVLGCGGAVMRHVAHGEEVQVIIVTDGAFDAAGEVAVYRRQRQLESRTAADILGYGEPVFWDYSDRRLCYGEKLIEEIITAIRTFEADLIYAPSVFEMHPDHRVLGMAAMEAVRRTGGSLRLAAYEVGVPLAPNLLLDISDLVERKQAAMQCFGSQNEKQRYDLHIAALNRYRTYTLPASVTAAEAYILVTAEALLQDPFKLYQSEYTRQRALGLPLENRDVPLVSVIIRSMDRPTLSDALDSVALQTYPNVEVVVVNAKGPGHRAVGDWCGRFPLRVVSDDNQPLARSRAANVGLDAARGNYLIFLDDDDEFLPHHIARLKAELDGSESVIAAYSAIRCIDASGQEIKYFAHQFDPIKLRIDNYIPVHAVLFRRLAVDQGANFDEALEVCEDWDFWLQLVEQGDFRFISETGAIYRIEQGKGSGIWQNATLTRRVITSIYLKWMPRWDGEVLWSLMDYARSKEVTGIREQELTDVRKELEEVYKTLGLRDQRIEEAYQMVSERDQWLEGTCQAVSERDEQLEISYKEIESYKQLLIEREKLLSVIQNSKSWKLTKPLRAAMRFFRTLKSS